MKVVLFTKDPGELNTEALVVGLYEEMHKDDLGVYNVISEGLVGDLVNDKEFTGKFCKISMLRLKGKIKRLVLVGLGKEKEFNVNKARQVIAKVAVYLRDNSIKEFSLVLFEDLRPYNAAYCSVEAVKLALYNFNHFKTQGLEDLNKVEQFTLIANANNFMEIDEGIRDALIISDSVCYVRDLQNKPSNVVTPSYLANEAKRIARRNKLKCIVYDKNDIEKIGMGGMIAVSKGSGHEPKFIVLEYMGGKETICFVGKGVTFDSGGISIKPSAAMDEMKFDMSGGAVVLGLIEAAARLKLPYHLVGLIPTVENLPGGNAYKPGDIIKHYNGKTSEIINTDAEGRLILADALAYSKNFKPKAVIDFATLTGACVISLGDIFTGMFSTDDELAQKLTIAGEKTGEEVWRLPLHDKYKEYIKSNVADLKNCGPRDGGAITAAMFLKEFVDCKKWVHLDIAGTAWTTKSEPLNPVGGTGVGVRLAIQLLKYWETKSN
ncbi:leucyl aminopeptidase [Candidatus Woesearchaeota archaeon]|nr:leucyl aminopeptidase [Candidatus Woesearchaeota archaeon]